MSTRHVEHLPTHKQPSVRGPTSETSAAVCPTTSEAAESTSIRMTCLWLRVGTMMAAGARSCTPALGAFIYDVRTARGYWKSRQRKGGCVKMRTKGGRGSKIKKTADVINGWPLCSFWVIMRDSWPQTQGRTQKYEHLAQIQYPSHQWAMGRW